MKIKYLTDEARAFWDDNGDIDSPWLSMRDFAKACVKKALAERVAERGDINWKYRCQYCGWKDKTTCRREIKTKNYTGPCGDSFCYQSCKMETCRTINVVICNPCAKKLTKEGLQPHRQR